MDMVEVNNKTTEKVDVGKIKKVTKKFLEVYDKNNLNVSIAFVDENEIRRLNKEYRHIDKVTDVLSFKDESDDTFGEIIICPKKINEQSANFGHTNQEELIFILVHGLLHLLGFNDTTGKEEDNMIKLGEEFIKKHV